MALGVPLDAEEPGMRIGFDGLDGAVLGERDHAQVGRDVLDPLMMEGVDEHLPVSDDALETRAGPNLDVVRPTFPRLALDVPEAFLPLRGQVLVERSSELDVEELAPAADPEDRHPALERELEDEELGLVALTVRDAEFRDRLLTVVRGIDVLASGQDQPGAMVEQVGDRGNGV